MQIYSAESHYDQTVDGLTVTRISLRLHLQSAHFTGHGMLPSHYSDSVHYNLIGHHTQHTPSGLLLRCTAQIAQLYEENTELELGVPPRDPVPARGEWLDGGCACCWCLKANTDFSIGLHTSG